MFEQPPVFLWHNQLYLAVCLSRVLLCLASLLSFINLVHSSMISLFMMPPSLFIHVSCYNSNMLMVLFMDLILSLKKALSALLMILQPFGVLMLLFSLILTGIRSTLRHLSKNLLQLWKSAILHSNLSHCQNNLTFSIPYSDLICRWMFLILFL